MSDEPNETPSSEGDGLSGESGVPDESSVAEEHGVAATPVPQRRPWMIAAAAIGAVAVLVFVVVALSVGPGQPDRHSAEEHAAEQNVIWTCSMHPQIRRNEPGSCPICGMDLIPLSSEGDAPLTATQVRLGPRARALARVQTTEVRRVGGPMAALRLLGRVDYDETTMEVVSTWIPGRIDRLHVDVTGQRIRRGQVVASLFSPEIYAAQQDLITATRQIERLASATALTRSAAEATRESARQRLRLLGVPDAEIASMERARAPSRQIAIRSTTAGTVIERLTTEGVYVQTGTPLYRVANLSRLWVQLDAYESDLAHLAVGQSVEVAVDALPGHTFDGRVAFLDPVVDAQRRTARVRVEISNPEGQLRPGMFVEAVVRGPEETETAQPLIAPLVVPRSAPLFTGHRSLVYVELPDVETPTYEARVVRLGPRMGDVYPVVSGLAAGERVVTRGAFAIDADLQIRGGESMMTRGGADDDLEPAPLATTPEQKAGLRSVIEPYLRMQESLADDDLASAKGAAGRLLDAAVALPPRGTDDASAALQPIAQAVRAHAQRARDADTLEDARAQLEPLTAQLVLLLRRFGNPTQETLRLAHCPMAFGNRGAEWIQTAERVDNAYFGASMLTCGSISESVPPGSTLGDRTVQSTGAAPGPGSAR